LATDLYFPGVMAPGNFIAYVLYNSLGGSCEGVGHTKAAVWATNYSDASTTCKTQGWAKAGPDLATRGYAGLNEIWPCEPPVPLGAG
jgi:hypothetical protein